MFGFECQRCTTEQVQASNCYLQIYRCATSSLPSWLYKILGMDDVRNVKAEKGISSVHYFI